MIFHRSGGILLHPTSLPGPYGIGDLGPQAYNFVEWLAGCGCKLWQILPLGPTGYGDSPYQCFSAFAGNPNLISPDLLIADGYLQAPDVVEIPSFSPSRVDYGRLISWKNSILEKAFKNIHESGHLELLNEFSTFRAENAFWLDDYSLFMALKESLGGGSWTDWPNPIRKRDATALSETRHSLERSILKHGFFQFIFFRQWNNLHRFANRKAISIIGDIPLYISLDSADVWAHPELFYLDENLQPTVVAGVPPDYFSPTGQLWGNPLFRWDQHKASGYTWWQERVQATLKTIDIPRLDHFRGFSGYWEIPAGNPTAEFGRWVEGPGNELIDMIRQNLKEHLEDDRLPIIAEDLGVITNDVIELRDRYQLPGMKIMQFGFSGPDNPFLPHNYVPNCVAYTGSHDNDTSRGWFESAPIKQRQFALRYLGATKQNFSWELIRAVWSSVAVFAITPVQDLLNLGTEARMNYPGTFGGNWEWRCSESAFDAKLGRRFANSTTSIYGKWKEDILKQCKKNRDIFVSILMGLVDP